MLNASGTLFHLYFMISTSVVLNTCYLQFGELKTMSLFHVTVEPVITATRP